MFNNPAEYAGGWNFGPQDSSFLPVGSLVDGIVKAWGEGSWEDHSNPDAPHEANILKLDISKAKSLLGWSPVWNIEKAIAETVAWYRQYHTGDMYELCYNQIIDYMSDKSKSCLTHYNIKTNSGGLLCKQ